MTLTKIAEQSAFKVVAGFVGVAMALSLSFGTFAQTTSADAVSDLQAQIAALMAQINGLQGGSSSSSSASAGDYIHHPDVDHMFNTNLYLGSRGTDVQMLQKALNNGGWTVAVSGAGSAGSESTYFGPATLAAVKAFQSANGISPVAGYFWPLTRAEMNRKAVGSSSSSDDDDDDDIMADGDELQVTGGSQPDDDFMFASTTRLVVTSFKLTAGDDDVDVESVTVRLNGRVDRASIDSVILLDEDMNIIGDSDSFDSDDEAEIGDDFTVDSGDTMKFYVAVNAASKATINGKSDDDDAFSIEVVEIETSADVDGLPVEGGEFTVDSGEDLGDVTVKVTLEGTSVEVGDEEKLIATLKVTANPDDNDDSVFVKSIRIEMKGTANGDDLDNIFMEVDGDEYEGEIEDDWLVFNFEDDGFELEESDNEDFEIFADIVGGATDTVILTFEDSSDVYVENEEGYGMPISLTQDASSFTIGAGKVDITSDDTVDTDEITNGDDMEIGSFSLEIEGEDVSADDIVLTIAIASTTSPSNADDGLLEDVYIEDENGDVILGTEDAVWTTNYTVMTVTWDNEDLSEMDDTVMFVKGTVDDNVTNGTTYTITSLAMTGVEGDISDETIIVGAQTASWPTMKVEAGALAVTVSTSPVAQNVAENTDNFVFAKYVFDAGDSGEDVELTKFVTNLTASSTNTEDDLNNCRIFNDGDEVALDSDIDGVEGDSTYTVRFEDKMIIEKDTSVTLELRCDIGGSTVSNGFTWGISTTASDVDADGDSTNNSITATVPAATGGQLMTIANAGLVLSEDSTSPSTQLVVAGNEVILGVMEIEANDGDVTLQELAATLIGTSTALVGEKVTIWVDGSQVGELQFNGSTSSDSVDGLSIDADDDEEVNLTFKGTISETGDTNDGIDGGLLKLSITAATTSQSSVSVTGAPVAFDTQYTFDSVPTLAEVSFTEDELRNGDNTALVFSLTADDNGDVVVGTTTFSVSFTGTATSTSLEVEVYSNSSLSNKVSVSGTDSFTGVSGASTPVSFLVSGDYLEVPAGDTYYFKVTSQSVTGAAASADSVTVELLEDTTVGGSNFKWTTDDGKDNSNWFSGFEVEGGDSDIKNTLNYDN